FERGQRMEAALFAVAEVEGLEGTESVLTHKYRWQSAAECTGEPKMRTGWGDVKRRTATHTRSDPLSSAAEERIRERRPKRPQHHPAHSDRLNVGKAPPLPRVFTVAG